MHVSNFQIGNVAKCYGNKSFSRFPSVSTLETMFIGDHTLKVRKTE